MTEREWTSSTASSDISLPAAAAAVPEPRFCGFCGSDAALWVYSLEDPDAGVRDFALPSTWRTCADCHDLWEVGRTAPLVAGLRAALGDWPDPEELVQAIMLSRTRMRRYEASYQRRSPDASLFPDDDVDVGPQAQSCGFCQGAVVWAYPLDDPDAGVRHFAVPATWWTCDECHDLLQAGRLAPLAARLRATQGDWPDPDELVRVVASSRAGPAERRR